MNIVAPVDENSVVSGTVLNLPFFLNVIFHILVSFQVLGSYPNWHVEINSIISCRERDFLLVFWCKDTPGRAAVYHLLLKISKAEISETLVRGRIPFSSTNDHTKMVTFSNSHYYVYPDSLNSFSWRCFINTGASRKDVYHRNWKFADRWM